MLITWSDDCATGIAELDARHKALIWLANGLHEAFVENGDPETLALILSVFAEYADFHFSRGEQLMRDHRYTRHHEFGALHNELVERLGTLIYLYETLKVDVSTETLAFLKDWLGRLIQQDRAFGRTVVG